MYTEEYEHKGFPIKSFLMKLILVFIFILLLIWLLPKIISPSVKTSNAAKCSGGASTCDTSGINALTSQIFADNLERMKEAAISYYTDERLPKEIGASESMTLSDMIGKKIISPLIDKNNKAVDVEKSYVKISKANDEYILKVFISDSEKEDYILVHLGCYTYCDTYICQKRETKTNTGTKNATINPVVPIVSPSPTPTPTPVNPTPTAVVTPKCQYVNGKYYDKNGSVVSEVNYLISCEAPVCKRINGYYFGKYGTNVSKSTFESQCNTEAPKCTYKNGNYYDKNGNIVSEVNYIISCQAPVCKVVNGYYFGKYGTNVNPETFNEQCNVNYICTYKNGNYYDKNGNIVSEVNYIISCQAPRCKMVNGYYFGKNGNKVTKRVYESECINEPEYIYEYSKTTGAVFSNWTSWSAWSKTNCSTNEVNCSDQSVNCLYKLQMLKRKEKIGTYQKTYARTRQIVKQTGQYNQKSCANYNYVQINNTTYATTTSTTYTTVNTITTTTQSSAGGWSYNGRNSYSNPPTDTANTHYKFAGADYSYCDETCTSLPNYYYDSYSYTGGLASVSSTTSSNTTSGAPLSSTRTVGQTTSYAASCGSIVEKTIPIYGTITVTEKASRTEPLYGTVCYKSTKNRKLISSGSTKTKWSYYNDTSLLNNGWVYTGRKKVK